MTIDPWIDLPRPDSASALSARRVSEEVRSDFFWARDAVGRCLLVLQHSVDFPKDVRIPQLTGVQLARRTTSAGAAQLVFALEDAELRDIFAELCRDIVGSTAGTESEEGALRVAVSRTWRWHHLLKRGSSRILSEEQQKGLIGEVSILEALGGRLDLKTVIESWTGPLGEPKDFVLPGMVAVESKAVRGTEAPFIQISSEWQLDISEVEALYLVVSPVNRSVESEPSARTLSDVVGRILSLTVARAPECLATLEAKLFAAGYRPEDDYSEFWWDLGELDVFTVTEGFPRLAGSRLPPGIERIRYNVNLSSCTPFRIDFLDFLKRMEPQRHE